MANSPTILALVGLALLCAAGLAAAQNCNCQPGFCCSKFGYCGTSDDYCGDGCQSGPCKGRNPPPSTGGGGANVEAVVSDSFFNGVKAPAPDSCEGKRFYTRDSFVTASRSYSGFARGRSEVEGKREIAAFFANVAHETGSLCYINEINGASRNYCDSNNREWPCQQGKGYYGRGPLQLSWNYNYGPAGRDIGFDGLRDPDRVARDNVVAFKTALWFWMNNVHQVMPQGFGATIRAINGALECNGRNPGTVESRVRLFRQFCQQLGVDPGGNLYC
ncbi:hypothetical protein PR202_gb15183 [Eleusine coracana subsp. coracana]|uniref:chitinase n=1 Tax=Eleusine coracana subsp. coracana TaxID=191504 RepID=A0AAV5EX51_ELECO|nr:hypothetical protein QOZ80_4BG0343620 [Eleusine coracana subsp. coracana]GJN27186.1 hypothetical protein PR202_gb15183 [Eleusine coracana subsp. coracana]